MLGSRFLELVSWLNWRSRRRHESGRKKEEKHVAKSRFLEVWELLFGASFLAVQKATLGTSSGWPRARSLLQQHAASVWRRVSFGGLGAALQKQKILNSSAASAAWQLHLKLISSPCRKRRLALEPPSGAPAPSFRGKALQGKRCVTFKMLMHLELGRCI